VNRSNEASASSKLLEEFPQDPNTEICPTQAIYFDNSSGHPVVKEDTCIGCGLCALRCPYGAIHLSASGKALVSHEDVDNLVAKEVTKYASEGSIPIRTGRLAPSELPSLCNLPDVIRTLPDATVLRMIANALSLLGTIARVRRRGDSNVRFDGLIEFSDGYLGVMEVELTQGVVESPRALLEDVAILHARYIVGNII
jgi:ferredoxin